ncbi:MAG: hypothetical protein V1835_03050, partial [Candidatus Micrarchaeota archaeon]
MIGIDFGASFVDIAVIEGNRLKRAYSIPQKHYSFAVLENILAGENDGRGKGKRKAAPISITGAKSGNAGIAAVAKKNPKLRELEKRQRIVEVGEIGAIAEGAKFLTGKEKFVVVNVGTGTPFVFVDGKKSEHIAGTGIGGGTLEGLARLLLNAEVTELEKIAKNGNHGLDLTVFDLVRRKMGKLPPETTASNFGKAMNAPKIKNEDVAASLLKMVGEILGVMGVLAIKGKGCEEIIFTGRVIDENATIRARIDAAVKLFGGRAIFPENAKYCTAIGAAILG